ncbi:MAG TPA: cytochrome P460 family protein [Kofleriaceae bacterium]|nr:cytochrome P460 family protein [Kofleriaceae bacterium]
MSLGLPAAALAGGDATAGKTKATACMACHVSASPTDDTPHLAGQRATYIAKQLKAYKAGDRKSAVMNAITSALNEGDIDNLAAFWAGQAAGSDTTLPPDIAAVKKGHMAFPKDFPKGFIQYRTTTKPDGVTVAKQWINKTGMDAVKAGKDKLPDGTVLIVENYAAKLDADKKPVAEKDGTLAVDKLKNYEGMEIRAGWDKGYPELLVNRDWNYAVFMPDKTQREVNQAICLSCHIPAASTDYVFTLDKIKAKAK